LGPVFGRAAGLLDSRWQHSLKLDGSTNQFDSDTGSTIYKDKGTRDRGNDKDRDIAICRDIDRTHHANRNGPKAVSGGSRISSRTGPSIAVVPLKGLSHLFKSYHMYAACGAKY